MTTKLQLQQIEKNIHTINEPILLFEMSKHYRYLTKKLQDENI